MKRFRITLRSPYPATLPRPVGLLLSFAAGLAMGGFLHYLLYRVSLPVEPFIYVAF